MRMMAALVLSLGLLACGVGVDGSTGGGSGGGGGGSAAGGGGGGGGGPTTGTFSCDTRVGGIHYCTEYGWAWGVYATTTWSSACSSSAGTAGTACTRSGAVAGCKITTSSGGITIATTSWYYSGTPSTVMMTCSAAGGTVVNP